ncbi:ATP/cobalamin adenosyltransferase [Natronococcus amylolyticus DSM 10524]|uniref:ATP/cobalamin adenosyltransferase n=1 Tax=Natronococcus amylolyticus DSM 10524 TaxID=1227497 RepID=L9WYP1_9EURY|nr:heme-binding protein [Natronococcus amylolyticus]ELY54517.1 ATP/cobalamin adenosyltransferase [Natronococcus amylolyticus DSM 10524]
MSKLTLDTAKEIVDAAEQRAAEIDIPMCVAVTDEGGNPVAFHRMDGALLASIDIARNKAYSSVAMEMETQTIQEVSQPGESLYGLGTTNDGRIVTFGGGLPLEDDDGTVVGGVGVSGGSADEDVDVAEAGVDAFERS